jgi:seryl-tRNA synthetase
MLTKKFLLSNFQEVLYNLQKRHYSEDFIKKVKDIENKILKNHNIEKEKQSLQMEKNILVKEGIKAKDKVIKINEKIQDLNGEIESLNNEIDEIIYFIPNLLDNSVPEGKSSEENIVVSVVGDTFKKPLKHYEMNLIDNGSQMASSRFIYLQGQISTLERALGNFLINFLVGKGFIEISVPLMLNEESLYKTGHLPKEKENMFYIQDRGLYLIPTSECVLLNIMADKTINIDKPIKYTAFNMNFRKEAGAAGKDTRGLIRLHQFPKVEMVAFTKQEDSESVFNEFVSNGEEALSLLGLSYRIVNLCAGDLGFNSSKTYDLEVWMAGSNEYREVSSISNCKDFQSVGLNCKYYSQEHNNEKKYLHTLNGTCLGVGRILAAIMENYYDEIENIIHVPRVLVPYTKFTTIKVNMKD